MGTGSLAASTSWKLAAPHDAEAQGLIASPFAHLDFGLALLLQVQKGAGGAWVSALLAADPSITPALKPATPSLALAFTWTGLSALGLDSESLASFPTPFTEGMRQIDRQRRLGDDGPTVIEGGAIWSGNAPDTFAPQGAVVAAPTSTTVHAALLLYAESPEALAALAARMEGLLTSHKVAIVRRIDLSLMRGPDGNVREHFGFVDGISQPVPYGLTIKPPQQGPHPDLRQAIAAGDILLGHTDAAGDLVPGPLTPEATVKGAKVGLRQGQAPPGYRDFGLNGAYLVMRELRQDVAAFWDSMKAAAQALGTPGRDAQWVAARVIGRTLNGDPLCKEGVIASVGANPANDFGFAADTEGLGCPLGSHMRRANPRDGLAPTKGDMQGFLEASNSHRFLRRGRKYGPPFSENPTADRGLLFMAINTDIARQFEFVQQTWMLNESFATLFDETDPLMGPKGFFTLPGKPLRTRVEVETYVRLVGGDYFFLPSLPALAYLGGL